jgi:carboxynorspermidine decarboxylase
METKAAGPGAFARFDLTCVPSPCFVVDEVAVRRNLAILKDVGDRAGAKVLLALKAFSMWSLADVVGEYLDGVCASGLWEARLARAHYRGHLTTYSPAYKREDLPEILRLSDSVIFNAPAQIARFADLIAAARADGEVFDIGLRLNPEHSEAEVAKYDPCQRGSRLGFPVSQLRPEHLDGVDGLHVHALCEQGFEPLQRIWASLEPRLEGLLTGVKWAGSPSVMASRSISSPARPLRSTPAFWSARSSMSSRTACPSPSPTSRPPATCPTSSRRPIGRR